MVLAAFALKFSVYAGLAFLIVRVASELDTFTALLLLSVLLASQAMVGVADLKKLIANFSVVHMTVTAFLLGNTGAGTEWALNFS